MCSTQVDQQDTLRKDERSTQNDPRRVAVMCSEFGFGPSKASRIVRAFSGKARQYGWDASDDDVFLQWLLDDAFAFEIEMRRDAIEKAAVLLHSDPTGEKATTRALRDDPTGAKARARSRAAA